MLISKREQHYLAMEINRFYRLHLYYQFHRYVLSCLGASNLHNMSINKDYSQICEF